MNSNIYEAGFRAGKAMYQHDTATAGEERRRYRHYNRRAFEAGYAAGFKAQETAAEKWDRERDER